jgi:4-aminobutyrate aminotransferase-like enzyme
MKLFKEELALYNHITISLKVRQRCTEVGALMILDEIQPGFGTGKLFGFQNYDVVPDVVVMGGKNGGGMLLALYSFICNDGFVDNPKNWVTSPFGGHPVIAACCWKEITETSLMPSALDKEKAI